MATNISRVVQYLWAATFLVQAAVCAILISRGHFRRLPFFTAYVALNLCQAVFLYLIYNYDHINWHTTFRAGWWSEAITLVARAFATVEVLHLVLVSYRGIWGLAWRLLAGTSLLALICVSLASGGDARWALMEADRGYHLIFATALIACLVMIRYYGIQVAIVYKVLLGGFCFYSCIKILINTVLQLFLYRQFVLFYPTWQAVVMFSFLIVVTSWAVALWRPLPATAAQQAVLPASVYLRISPEINRQLQAINKQLMNFFKIEEPRQ